MEKHLGNDKVGCSGKSVISHKIADLPKRSVFLRLWYRTLVWLFQVRNATECPNMSVGEQSQVPAGLDASLHDSSAKLVLLVGVGSGTDYCSIGQGRVVGCGVRSNWMAEDDCSKQYISSSRR